jgi:hypothetical protein
LLPGATAEVGAVRSAELNVVTFGHLGLHPYHVVFHPFQFIEYLLCTLFGLALIATGCHPGDGTDFVGEYLIEPLQKLHGSLMELTSLAGDRQVAEFLERSSYSPVHRLCIGVRPGDKAFTFEGSPGTFHDGHHLIVELAQAVGFDPAKLANSKDRPHTS